MTERENWLTISEAADRLGLTANGLRENSTEDIEDDSRVWCVRRRFGRFKDGDLRKNGDRRYHVEEIENWRHIIGLGRTTGAKKARTAMKRGVMLIEAERDFSSGVNPLRSPGSRAKGPKVVEQVTIDEYLGDPGYQSATYDFLLDPFDSKRSA